MDAYVKISTKGILASVISGTSWFLFCWRCITCFIHSSRRRLLFSSSLFFDIH